MSNLAAKLLCAGAVFSLSACGPRPSADQLQAAETCLAELRNDSDQFLSRNSSDRDVVAGWNDDEALDAFDEHRERVETQYREASQLYTRVIEWRQNDDWEAAVGRLNGPECPHERLTGQALRRTESAMERRREREAEAERRREAQQRIRDRIDEINQIRRRLAAVAVSHREAIDQYGDNKDYFLMRSGRTLVCTTDLDEEGTTGPLFWCEGGYEQFLR